MYPSLTHQQSLILLIKYSFTAAIKSFSSWWILPKLWWILKKSQVDFRKKMSLVGEVLVMAQSKQTWWASVLH